MYADWTPATDLMVLALFGVILSVVWGWMLRNDRLPCAINEEDMTRTTARTTKEEEEMTGCIDCDLPTVEGRDRCFVCTNHFAARYDGLLEDMMMEPCGYCGDSLDPNDMCEACWKERELELEKEDRDNYDLSCDKHGTRFPVFGFCPPCEDEAYGLMVDAEAREQDNPPLI